MLALENALLYRGILHFFELPDALTTRLLVYGGLTLLWILVTTFGFAIVSRFSSLLLISFLLVMAWVLARVIVQADSSIIDILSFKSQFPDEALQSMGIVSDWDKFVFSMNILIGPACALPLVSVDYGRYARSTMHATTAVVIGSFFQSILVTLAGGILMYAAAAGLSNYYVESQGMSVLEAQQLVLKSPDSIAAAFMLFGGIIGFLLMFVAQAKAQVLNCYAASLSLTNFFDALLGWRPGRFTFIVFANVIALAMLYGHILELVEAWISLLGVLLSTLSGVILVDYFFVSRRPGRSDADAEIKPENLNWAGIITIFASVIMAHYVLADIITIEVITSCLTVLLLYPLLRLFIFSKAGANSN